MTRLAPNILVPVLFFLTIIIFCLMIIKYVNQRNKNKALVKKIQQGADFHGQTEENKDDLDEAARTTPNFFVSFFSLFGKNMAKKDASPSDSKPLKLKFLKAGVQWENYQAAFWGAKFILPVLTIGLFIAVKVVVFKTMTPPMMIASIVVAALFGFYLPDLWLKNKADKKKEVLFKGLPDTLDMLVVCVEAGMGLDSAMDRVGKEMELIYPELSKEFALMNLEIRAGKPRDEALRNLALRSNLDEMNSLITLLIQTNKFGTSVATALKVFAESFRTKRFQKAEEIAAKLPVTILLPLLFFIFPSMFVIILGPAAISIYENIINL
jgi:tight adherence protein C